MNPDSVIKLLTPERLNEAIARQLKWVDLWLEDKPTSLMPHACVEAVNMQGKEQHISFALAVDFNTEVEKHGTMVQLAQEVYDQKLIPLVMTFSCEAWVSSQSAGEPRKYLLPEDDPDRREVVSVFGLSLNGVARHADVEITRDRRRMIKQGEWRHHDAGTIRLNLLDRFFTAFYHCLPIGMQQDLQAKAKQMSDA